ncbi:hypothetical protein QUW57_04175 [Phocaeicola plebeius]|uniref:hypothetical protein n=1 Tax=Phocaeicola plebeius TaxID=310297 RepID=UPI0021AC9510|nr:hypothetical protein [Phocaeicola plebeius]MCR8882628.1 hypothetical protein [Phocaeicola plebeius]MDM8285792.1 hypothetical protein [Phocaeicola plebeius]
MKKVNSLKFWHELLFMLMMVSFTACVDDNEDTEAPYLEVNPATLTFENGGVQTLEISTNRQWKATVEDADWISLSKIQGEGSDQIQVSVPEGTIGEAKINIIMSNRSGILKSATVNVKAGTVIESKLIYNETLGNADASQKPYISDYQGWNKSGDGATSVEYAGNKTSIRSSGLTNTDAYEGASGPNVVFFGTAPATFDINKIALAEGQTNLKLTFGASRSKQNEDKSYDNSFTPETFKVSVSSNGTNWQEITYEKNNGDADHPYWILATANFTLKKAVPELYIRFTASESSVFRLDDISLSTGYGGQEVNLEEGNEPTITSVDPKTITFTDKGGNQDVKVTLANAEGKSLTVSGLSGILSANVNGTTVTVTANPNTTEAAIKQTLTIKIEGTERSVEVPVTVTPQTAEGNIIVMSSSDIINGKTGTVELLTKPYGQQKVQDESTWYTWNHNSIDFKGVKIGIAPENNGGGIQFQGDDANTEKQGFIFNTTKIEQIQYIEITLKTASSSPYDPAYHVYAGTSPNPTTTAIESISSMQEENGLKVYTQTFDFTSSNYDYFTIKNDKKGAIYINSIKITKK